MELLQLLDSAAAQKSQTDSVANSVAESVTSGKRITINPKAVTRALDVEADAANLVHGKNGALIPCVQPSQCQTRQTEFEKSYRHFHRPFEK